jgi:hypothetical protein
MPKKKTVMVSRLVIPESLVITRSETFTGLCPQFNTFN